MLAGATTSSVLVFFELARAFAGFFFSSVSSMLADATTSSVLVFFALARAFAGFFFSSVSSVLAGAITSSVFATFFARALVGFFSSTSVSVSAMGTFFFLSILVSDTLNCPIELVILETHSSVLSFTECSESESDSSNIT